MQSILPVNVDARPFETSLIEHILRTEPGFHDLRVDEPGGRFSKPNTSNRTIVQSFA